MIRTRKLMLQLGLAAAFIGCAFLFGTTANEPTDPQIAPYSQVAKAELGHDTWAKPKHKKKCKKKDHPVHQCPGGGTGGGGTGGGGTGGGGTGGGGTGGGGTGGGGTGSN